MDRYSTNAQSNHTNLPLIGLIRHDDRTRELTEGYGNARMQAVIGGWHEWSSAAEPLGSMVNTTMEKRTFMFSATGVIFIHMQHTVEAPNIRNRVITLHLYVLP